MIGQPYIAIAFGEVETHDFVDHQNFRAVLCRVEAVARIFQQVTKLFSLECFMILFCCYLLFFALLF